MNMEGLLAQLDTQKDAYIDTFQRAHHAFVESIARTGAQPQSEGRLMLEVPPTSPQSPTVNVSHADLPASVSNPGSPHLQSPPLHIPSRVSVWEHYHPNTGRSNDGNSSTDGSDGHDDEDFCVTSLLPSHSFDLEHLYEHLRTYSFDAYSRQILAGILTDGGRLRHSDLFSGSVTVDEEKRNYSHYQVFDVGSDGIPRDALSWDQVGQILNAGRMWNAIKDVTYSATENAVGRIIVAREPSSAVFGALHLTHNRAFDMDEIYDLLVGSDASSFHVHRAFDNDERRRRSVVLKFEYFTITGEERRPMAWQLTDVDEGLSDTHLPISRCSCVIALSLHGGPLRRVRDPDRRMQGRNFHGTIYDPWQAWQVLNIQCQPDWRAKTDIYEGGKQYINGPLVFLDTFLTEIKTMRSRFAAINEEISKLIATPSNFIFSQAERDKRLFEDSSMTYSRRHFWGHQALASMDHSIESIIGAFESNFPEELWEGRHRTLWPLLQNTGRDECFRKHLRTLREAFKSEIKELRALMKKNEDRRTEIRYLSDQLFAGTAVQGDATGVEQGRIIKVLTLVNLFFLPLQFCTSIFGMQMMPNTQDYTVFAIVITTVCIPFFLLVGSLNSRSGFFWWVTMLKSVGKWVAGRGKEKKEDDANAPAHRSAGRWTVGRYKIKAPGYALNHIWIPDPLKFFKQQQWTKHRRQKEAWSSGDGDVVLDMPDYPVRSRVDDTANEPEPNAATGTSGGSGTPTVLSPPQAGEVNTMTISSATSGATVVPKVPPAADATEGVEANVETDNPGSSDASVRPPDHSVASERPLESTSTVERGVSPVEPAAEDGTHE